jgi:hypothetical protein
MQKANILLALAGDKGNTVPKYGVTIAEIAVLMELHGNESVTDIEPIDEVPTNHRAERARLLELYGRMEDGKFTSKAVEKLFPGAAARVFEHLDELELPEEFFKAEKRVSTATRAVHVEDDETDAAAPKPAKGKPRGRAAKAKAQEQAAPEQTEAPQTDGADDDEAGDGIEDMDDGVGKSDSMFQ